MTQPGNDSVPPGVYTREYYESNCQGYAEFRDSAGQTVPDRLRIPLELAQIAEGMSVLDVGCGRGEIVFQAARQGARAFGFDYAMAAVQIAAAALAGRSEANQLLIHLGNARHLPYSDNCFDRVFMLDVVEHLYPAELHEAFTEIRRVLRPDGRLIVHTMPNTWYYRLGYPLFRIVQRVRGKRLPANPRERWRFYEVHVNEQNPIALHLALRAAGYRARIWLRSTQTYAEEPSRFVRLVMRALVTLYPFRWIFCNDLFGVATK